MRIFRYLIILFLFLTTQVVKSNNVYVGTYLTDITSFDLKEGRFNADIRVWCKWMGDTTIPNIQFANAEIQYLEVISKESEGSWNSVQWRLQGTFRGTFPLHNFPFDKQQLSIDIVLPKKAGTLQPDLAGSGMANKFSISGWNYEPYFKADIQDKKYQSDFGSIEFEGKPLETTKISFLLDLDRPITGMVVKYIFPLVIIIIVALSALFIRSENVDVRIDIGVNSLLACVAFQFALSDSIPDVSYIILSDQFFTVAYLVILAVILIINISFKISATNPHRAKLLDRVSAITLPNLLILFSILRAVNFNQNVRAEISHHTNPHISAIEYPKSSKDTLVNTIVSLRHLNIGGIQSGLIDRGLYHYHGEKRVPHLVEKVPSMTNELVRLLPNGGIVVTWKLKPDIFWGDGTRITTGDLLFSAKLKEDNNRDSIVVIDDRRMDIYYSDRRGSVLNKFHLYPKHQFESVYNAGGMDSIYQIMKYSPPPMDGPYYLEKFVKDSFAIFKVNPNFVGKTPAIEFIKIRGLMGKSTGELVARNQTDVVTYLSMKSFRDVDSAKGYVTKTEASPRLVYLQPDLSLDVFKNDDFRKAVFHAIDREKILQIMDGGSGQAAFSYRPSIASDALDSDSVSFYDPILARQFLKKSGVQIQQPIRVIGYHRGPGTGEYEAMNLIVNNLKEIGIPAELHFEKNWWKLSKSADHKSLLFLASNYTQGHPGRFWGVPYSPEKSKYPLDSAQGLVSDWLVQKMHKYSNTLFDERKAAISKQIQKEYMDVLPTIPLVHLSERSVAAKNLVGWDHLKVIGSPWWNVEYLYFENQKESKDANLP